MINATTVTVRAVTKTFQLAGILDDRCAQPDKARIAAWAEQVQRHRLTENDLLDGLQAFYDTPSERAIQIGDLIHHARNAKRTRLDKEADEIRDQRQDTLDLKAADDVRTMAAGVITEPTKNRTPRLVAAENALQCVVDKATALAAIREYLAAKAEAQKPTAPTTKGQP